MRPSSYPRIPVSFLCPTCDARQRVNVQDLLITLEPSEFQYRYSVNCPECKLFISAPLAEEVIIKWGVVVKDCLVVLPEREQTDAPLLTEDDYLDFKLALQQLPETAL